MPITSPQSSFTRPANATPYAAGNLIANNTTAGSVVPLSWLLSHTFINGYFTVKRVSILKTTTGVSGFKFNLHLYSAAPTFTNGDGGAYLSNLAANYFGFIQCDGTTTPGQKFSDGAVALGAAAAGSEFNVQLPAGRTIFGALEATGAYTPGSAEVITVTLDLIEYFARGT